ncbi:hypothetical protein QQF64_028691 [Cirrhinus molitorella]|uniref:L27 domain-containing protein n=1 Tax=Cirrhinus molitorella TaxID=172907 RepID=A0ABR3N7K2_9TELE
MPVRKKDAQKALQLLEEYRTKLSKTGDPHLRHSIERVINVFQSTLFQALIDIQEFYEVSLQDNENKPIEPSSIKTREPFPPVNEWNLTGPSSTTGPTETVPSANAQSNERSESKLFLSDRLEEKELGEN